MPELPEVETVVRDLNKKVRGRIIQGVWFDWPKMIKDIGRPGAKAGALAPGRRRFVRDLLNEQIISAKRLGKNILIYLTHDKVLLIHQKMTGHLLVGKWKVISQKSKVKSQKVVPLEPRAVVNDPYNGYIHLILTLDDKRMIALSDVRKFAKAILGSTEQIENLEELQKLGPDALDPKLTFKKFADVISSEGRTIKQVLMDPNVIAGIGNIYSDDILWQAKVHPKRKPSSLSESELKTLYRSMRAVLAKAVKLRGTSTSDFRDTAGEEGNYTGYRLVYQRTGEPCKRCKTPIQRLVIGGRSAHFCPNCQKI